MIPKIFFLNYLIIIAIHLLHIVKYKKNTSLIFQYFILSSYFHITENTGPQIQKILILIFLRSARFVAAPVHISCLASYIGTPAVLCEKGLIPKRLRLWIMVPLDQPNESFMNAQSNEAYNPHTISVSILQYFICVRGISTETTFTAGFGSNGH